MSEPTFDEVTFNCYVCFKIESTDFNGAWITIKLMTPDGDVIREYDSQFLHTGNTLNIGTFSPRQD